MRKKCCSFGVVCLLLASVIPALAADVAIVGTVLTDNGDQDGYADTHETVTLRLVLRNLSDSDLTGLVARVATEDAALACLTDAEIAVGDLLAGEERTTDEGFVFVVAPDVERSAIDQELSVAFTVHVRTPDGARVNDSRPVVLDLDLDLAGGSGPTTFFESFEDGFGAFTTMHLDEPLNPPESDLGNRPAGVLNADGHRCQYSDPEWHHPFGNSGTQCFANPNGAGDAFYFRVVADRAFSGTQAMAFNVFLDDIRGYTTPNSQLEAIRTAEPVHLAWQGACSESASVCLDDEQCPAGEACLVPQPKLSFKHQISHLDHRSVNAQRGRAADRSVIGVQLADDGGAPVGPWLKAYPFVNTYDSQANSNYTNCSFDPADDGNDEGDFFDPTDPLRSLGPSSTCAPEFVFAHQGDTADPFDPGDVGDADTGTGLEGAFGTGTWVEPVVDLSRFRGRQVHVRFLTTGLKLGGAQNWEQAFHHNPDPGDDGWFLDDVEVSDTLVVPAVATVDGKDNSGLPTVQGDTDLDGIFDACDNCAGTANDEQADADGDGLGDFCDPCPDDPDDDLDGDGYCGDVDNCPAVFDPSQADADGDGIGDLCDACPLTPNPLGMLDYDDDGVACDTDNCPSDSNADQLDADGDHLGDTCDDCPDDPLNDPDGDEVCHGVDSCPLIRNDDQDATIRLANTVRRVRLSPDGSRLLLTRWNGQGYPLYSMPAAGGVSIALSPTGVSDFAWTPDGRYAIYGDGFAYRVPASGGGALRLGTSIPPGVVSLVVGPAGADIVVEVAPSASSGAIYSVPIGGGRGTLLSPAVAPGTRSTDATIAPDGSRVLFYRDPPGFGTALTELHCAAIDGSATTRVSPLESGAIGPAAFDPSGSTIVYTARQTAGGVVEVFSVPCDGSQSPTRLNAPMPAGAEVGSPLAPPLAPFRISPDGSTVAYVAEQFSEGRYDLLHVPLLGGTATRVPFPSFGQGSVAKTFDFTPDGASVVAVVGSFPPGGDRLFVAPLDGSPAILLHATPADQEIGDDWAITPDGSRAVIRVDPSGEIHSVPLTGAPGVLLSGSHPGVPDDALRLSADGQHLLYAGKSVLGSTNYFSLFSAPVTGGDPVLLDSSVDEIVAWSADGSVATWINHNLYASWREPDGDADGIHAACDCDDPAGGARVADEVNDGLDGDCPGEPGFGVADELSPTVLFGGSRELPIIFWSRQPGATAYEVVRSTDRGFETGCACQRLVSAAIGREIPEAPSPGETFHYLVRSGAPFRGSAGAASSGIERSGACLATSCIAGAP